MRTLFLFFFAAILFTACDPLEGDFGSEANSNPQAGEFAWYYQNARDVMCGNAQTRNQVVASIGWGNKCLEYDHWTWGGTDMIVYSADGVPQERWEYEYPDNSLNKRAIDQTCYPHPTDWLVDLELKFTFGNPNTPDSETYYVTYRLYQCDGQYDEGRFFHIQDHDGQWSAVRFEVMSYEIEPAGAATWDREPITENEFNAYVGLENGQFIGALSPQSYGLLD